VGVRTVADFFTGNGGGNGSSPTDSGVPDSQTVASPRADRPDRPDAPGGVGLAQPTQPVRVSSEFDTTVNLGDISVEVTADFDQLRRDLLSEVRSALDSQRRDLESEIDSVQDDIERQTNDLERRISRAVSTTQ
jgi:hypothetical protein